MDEARNPFGPRAGDTPGVDGVALIGRARELRAIDSLVAQLVSGASSVPLVFSGRSGVGTSAMLGAATTRFAQSDWYYGSAHVTAAAPLRETIGAAFARSLHALAARRPGAGGLRAACDAVAGFCPAIADQLPTGVSADALGIRRGDLSRDLRRMLARIADGLHELVGRGLVVMLDDLHCADPDDGEVLLRSFAEAMRDGQPIGLIAAGTPTTRWLATRADVDDAVVDVTPLNAAEVEAFLAARLASTSIDISSDAVGVIARATAGYPELVLMYAREAWRNADGTAIVASDVTSAAGAVRALLAKTVLEPAFAVSAAARRYARAVAEADDPAESDDIARRLGDTTRFGAGSSQLLMVRDDLIRRGVLATTDGIHLSFAHPASRSFVLSWS